MKGQRKRAKLIVRAKILTGPKRPITLLAGLVEAQQEINRQSSAALRGLSTLHWHPWVIDLGWGRVVPGAHPYAGPYLLERVGAVMPWQRGVPVAFFKTRREARALLRRLKRKNPNARISRVCVSLMRSCP